MRLAELISDGSAMPQRCCNQSTALPKTRDSKSGWPRVDGHPRSRRQLTGMVQTFSSSTAVRAKVAEWRPCCGRRPDDIETVTWGAASACCEPAATPGRPAHLRQNDRRWGRTGVAVGGPEGEL